MLALKQKGGLEKKILKGGGSYQKKVPFLKGGDGKVEVKFSWPNSKLKILALWVFLGIQETQNSKFSPTMVELYCISSHFGNAMWMHH